MTNNLYKFVVPAVAGPARLVPLTSLADDKARITVSTEVPAFLPTGQLRDGEPIWLLAFERGGGSGAGG